MKVHANQRLVTCAICHQKRKLSESRLVEVIRPGVAELVLQRYPNLKATDYLCRRDLAIFRQRHIENILMSEKGELTKLDHEVIKSMVNHETLARNINSQFVRKLSVGEKAADAIASFGGSWTFIVTFFFILFAWMAVNVWVLSSKPFDPFPFILLNLVLSCLAAIQAPIIMMSQNRKEAKDRLRAENDYKVNLKAELQIRQLNEKIDYLTQQQWHRLIEMQELEIDLLEQDSKRRRKKK